MNCATKDTAKSFRNRKGAKLSTCAGDDMSRTHMVALYLSKTIATETKHFLNFVIAFKAFRSKAEN